MGKEGEMSEAGARVTALGARVHLFVRPEHRQRFVALFRDLLECDPVERDFGLPYPILFVPFGDGSGFSVEFTDAASNPPEAPPVTDATAFRGAWIEFRTTDLPYFQQKLRDAGIPAFHHAGSSHLYFSAPGGQVFRLLDASYQGP
jgi:hypothetical protein